LINCRARSAAAAAAGGRPTVDDDAAATQRRVQHVHEYVKTNSSSSSGIFLVDVELHKDGANALLKI